MTGVHYPVPTNELPTCSEWNAYTILSSEQIQE